MKIDLSKILLSYSKNLSGAKKVSVKVFAITEKTRDLFIKQYCEFTRQVFFFKFIIWRAYKYKFQGIVTPFDLKEETDKIRARVLALERFLFDELDKFALNVIMQNQKVEIKKVLRTRLSIENINWKNDLSTVKIDAENGILHGIA
jgi:hypothetical protein